jgi:hypothetical protein
MEDDRSKDQAHKLVPAKETGQSHRTVSVDVIKSAYIAEGLSVTEIAERYYFPVATIEKFVTDHQLVELRKAYMLEGLAKIKNTQLGQAQDLLNMELDFKKLRLIQLQRKLEDFAAYYARHGDFCKRHPVTGEILKDTDGMAMQLSVPNVTREIQQLKESLTLSEGLKNLITHIDDIINGKPKPPSLSDPDSDVIEMDVEGYFKKK